MNRPPVVSAERWQAARAALLVREKELTRALDALAAQRRRLPMVRLNTDYRFTAPDGSTVGWAGLFAGRRQLVVYHFMLDPGQDGVCGGCASFTDNVADQSQWEDSPPGWPRYPTGSRIRPRDEYETASP
ncbi:MAG: DUF899 family protein [Pseudonocardia sp.]|nr:DUF899 family protein [Pseudonocardia sp.]